MKRLDVDVEVAEGRSGLGLGEDDLDAEGVVSVEDVGVRDRLRVP